MSLCQYQSGDKANDHWYPYPPEYGSWVQNGIGYDCSADIYTDLRPDDVEYWTRECKQDYQRSVKEKEINHITNQIRYSGVITYEDKTETINEAWIMGDPFYYNWYDISSPYNCTYPQTSTLEITGDYSLTLFCDVDRERSYQPRLVMIDSDGNPLQYRNYGAPKLEQDSFQDNYIFLVNDADVYKTCAAWQITPEENATSWSPDASNYARSQTVNQSRIVEKYRHCDHKTDLEGHTYTVDTSVEYKNETQNRSINGSKVNLKDWRTYDTNGVWSVASDGSYIYQSKNGDPTIYESPTKDYGKDEGSVFEGYISVANDGDDDYIGFVMGKQDLNNFYLWSWKKGNQGAGKKGHTFAKVTGGVNVIGWDTHVTKTGYSVIDTDLKKGWMYDKKYHFRIEYKRDNVRLFIDGKLLFDVDDTFPKGGVGFYNNSQSKVTYYKISEEPYYE